MLIGKEQYAFSNRVGQLTASGNPRMVQIINTTITMPVGDKSLPI